MPPCEICKVGMRRGRGKGWCDNVHCREETKARAEEDRAQKRQRREENHVGSRGPLQGEGSYRKQRAQLQAARSEQGAGSRGPMQEEGSRRQQQQQLQAARIEQGAGSRGPMQEEGSRRQQQQQLQAARTEQGAGSRGPMQEEGSYREQRALLQAARCEQGAGSRGPIAQDFLRSWCRFGLSRVCQVCFTLTPARHCLLSKTTGQLACKNCREKRGALILQPLTATPDALLQLQPLERQLLAMARISQRPMGQNVCGADEPRICDVLEGAEIKEDGSVHVEGVEGLTQSPARLGSLYRGLQALQAQHRAYQGNPAVDEALAKMKRALDLQAINQEVGPEDMQEAWPEDQDIELTADAAELNNARRGAELEDDADVKFFPHLFPDGVGGWRNAIRTSASTREGACLQTKKSNKDKDIGSPEYIMWLLEKQMKKRLTGNINVRISNQQRPNSHSNYEDAKTFVHTALRDMPGTQPYLFAKKGTALNMYEQLGRPQFFLTLTCHARQPELLTAAIVARLLRLRPEIPADTLEREAAEIYHQHFTADGFKWDGFTANELCNSQPAIVARQFTHQFNQFMRWLTSDKAFRMKTKPEADAQDEEEDDGASVAPPIHDVMGEPRRVEKDKAPFHVLDYI
ncbi:unnamed protein product, partial [Durusdinium trenchii]